MIDINLMSALCMHTALDMESLRMKSLTVRGVEDGIYEALRDLAAKNRRSMQEQVKLILEREVSLSRGGHLSRCLAIRKRLEDRDWGNVVTDIRRERER